MVENTISASLILVEKFVPMRIQWSNPCGQKDSVLTVRWYDGVTRYKRPFVVYESCPHENGEWRVISCQLSFPSEALTMFLIFIRTVSLSESEMDKQIK